MYFKRSALWFYFEECGRKLFNSARLDSSEKSWREKKEKKSKKKKAYLRGLRGGFGQSFPTVPTRGSSGGVEGESSSPVINTGLISRLLIKCFFQCVWEHRRPNRRKSAWSCVSYRGNGVDVFFSCLRFFFFLFETFFFSFFIFSQRDEQGVRNGGVGRARMFVFTKRRAS